MLKWIGAALSLALWPGARRSRGRSRRSPGRSGRGRRPEKILNDSPWGRTQVEADTSEMFFRPQGAPNAATGESSADPTRAARGGATNQATDVKYRIRLFSARPVRQALARAILLDAKQPEPQLLD